ncbi:Restriction endonuclease [Lachnospiraceae bacterium]|nr:Restriction endonuclease [Lachnospiraceae bacterium]
MSLIDFKEIMPANCGDGKQDSFELFAREFFHTLGFIISDGPDRGPDGGRDIIIEEKRTGKLGDTKIKWLVSCKHFVHSGKSVTDKDEIDITGRVDRFNCDGFIGFYSTIVSSTLNDKFNSYHSRLFIQVFDNEKIERILLDEPKMEKIVQRFFPNSFKKIYRDTYEPIKLYGKYQPLYCDICGKDLLQPNIIKEYQGIVGFVVDSKYNKTNNKKRYSYIYVACKGECDHIASEEYAKDSYTEWEDISDIAIPTPFLQYIMSFINGINKSSTIYSDEAYSKMKDIILKIAQLVMRESTEREMARIKDLQELPDWI